MRIRASWLQRLGLPPRERERALWLIGGRRQAFESIAPLLEEIARAQPRIQVILSTDNTSLRSWLMTRFPDCVVWTLPLNNRLSTQEFLARGNIRVAVALEDVSCIGRALIAGLKRRAVTLVALSGRTGAPPPTAPIADACGDVLAVDDAARPGVESDPSALAKRGLSNSQAAALLGELLGRDLKARRESVSPAGWFWRLAVSNCDRRVLNWRLQRYHDAGELRAALGDPAAILCLGNGPSSEDPALDDVAYDVLFRVNHSWLERGYLTKPSVVFTGGRPTMRAVPDAIFGLQSSHHERRLAAARLFNPLAPSTRFFNVAAVNPLLRSFDWGPLRPTNGASMLAAAVALKPQRLIIAGIDMFQHPAGSYPGDETTPNAFSPAHTRDAELAFLMTLFDSFRGDLVIIGNFLEQEWMRHQEAQAANQRVLKCCENTPG